MSQAVLDHLESLFFLLFLQVKKCDSGCPLYKFCCSNLKKCLRAPNHPLAFVKINNQPASRLVQNFVCHVFCIESILPAKLLSIKRS